MSIHLPVRLSVLSVWSVLSAMSVVVVAAAASVVAFGDPVSASEPVVYRPPVTAPVSDPFRAPTDPYGPGNRGLEYGTEPATLVFAAAAGIVTFAGPVAGDQWVTIGHTDGIRTSYGPLASIDTEVGATVEAGATIGATRDRLLFTARLGEVYLDPAVLLAASPGSVRLVPEKTAVEASPPGTVLASGNLDPSWFQRAVEWARNTGLAATSSFGTEALDFLPLPSPIDLFATGLRWLDQRRDCTPPAVVPESPAGRRVAIQVAGLGSTSEAAAIDRVDLTTLGYDPGDSLRFSYRGGRVAGTVAVELDGLAVNPYDAADTLGDLVTAGHRLAGLIRATAEAVPTDVPLDLLAHSQGGIVTRLALAELAITHQAVIERVGIVVTMGTPHLGADLAGAIASMAASVPLAIELEAVQLLLGLKIEPDAIAVQQLAPGSHVMRRLASTPLPDGPRVVSIAARSDPVVPATRSRLRGATNVVVAVEGLNDHDSLPGSEPVTREIGLAVAGLAPTCESVLDAFSDTAAGEFIAGLEGLLGLAARTLATAAGG